MEIGPGDLFVISCRFARVKILSSRANHVLQFNGHVLRALTLINSDYCAIILPLVNCIHNVLDIYQHMDSYLNDKSSKVFVAISEVLTYIHRI